MVVVCERCKTRFRLDESRISKDGAKVRCSRCHHKFLVKHGSAPGAASEAGRPENTAPRSPQEEPDLENPEFLLDRPPRARAVGGAPPAKPEGAPLAREEEADLFARESTPESQATERELHFGTSFERPAASDPSPGAAEGPELELDLPPRPEPPPPSAPLPRPALTAPPEPRPASEWGSQEATASASVELRSVPPSTPARVRKGKARAPTQAAVGAVPPLPRALGAAALAVGLALAFASLRSLALGALGAEAQPVTVRGAGWSTTALESFHVRDASGERVLVVRGRLAQEEPRPVPRVLGTLTADDGSPLGPEVAAGAEWLGDERLLPGRLSELLSGWATAAPPPVVRADAGGRSAEFTLLFVEPAASARGVALRLEPPAPGDPPAY